MKDLEIQAKNKEMKTQQLLNTIDLDLLSQDEIVKRYALIMQKLQNEIYCNKDLSERLEESQHKTIERNAMEKKYIELQHAHTEQQNFVQQLQKNIEKATKYKPMEA